MQLLVKTSCCNIKFFYLQKTEKTEFLNYFYKHCMHIMVAPLLAATADAKVGKCECYTWQFSLSVEESVNSMTQLFTV